MLEIHERAGIVSGINKENIRAMLLLLFNYLKTKEAISYEDGEKLFLTISDSIKAGISIVVDFSEVSFVTATFLNAAFGQLVEIFTEKEIKGRLRIINMDDGTKLLLDEVLLRSKEYYSDPESFTETANNILYGI